MMRTEDLLSLSISMGLADGLRLPPCLDTELASSAERDGIIIWLLMLSSSPGATRRSGGSTYGMLSMGISGPRLPIDSKEGLIIRSKITGILL